MAGDRWYDAWLKEKLHGSRGAPPYHERSRSRSGRRLGSHSGNSHIGGGYPPSGHSTGSRDGGHPSHGDYRRGDVSSRSGGMSGHGGGMSRRRSCSRSQPLRLQAAVRNPVTLRESPREASRDGRVNRRSSTAEMRRRRSASRTPVLQEARPRQSQHAGRHGDRHHSRGDSRDRNHRHHHHDRDRDRIEWERAERDRAEREERARLKERDERARLKEREERTARGKRKLADAVKAKRVGAALEAALDLIELGEKPLPKDLMCGMLHNAAARPGAEHFVKTVQCCVLGEIQIDPQSFAKLLGLLMSRDASHAQIRAVLNMALPRGVEMVPLVPDDLSIEETLAAFQDAEVPQEDGEAQEEATEAAADDSGIAADGPVTDEADAVKDAPPVLVFKDCEAQPDLNGEYHLHDAMPDVLNHSRPVYIADQGTDTELYVYYWEEHPSRPWLTGWWLGSEVGGSEVFAYNPGADSMPPKQRWQVLVDGQRRPDAGNFCQPDEIQETAAPAASAEDEPALTKLDLPSVQGLVSGGSSSSGSSGKSWEAREREAISQKVAAYFAHFMVLMHLEHLYEISIFRRRLQRRAIDRLVRMGWAFDGIECLSTYGRRESRRGLLPGWPDRGAQFVAFRTPLHADLDHVRFRKGDSVIISRSDPLKDRVAEGTCVEMDRRKTVVQVFGEMPDDARRVSWRLDAYVNRTVYERQVTALLQLATSKDLDPVCELLVAGNVGQLDAWAKRAVLPPWRRNREPQPVSKSSQDGTRSAVLAAEEADGIDKVKAADACIEARSIRDLNDSQKLALEAALKRRCTIVQGPPGTGKTHVSVKILQLWTQTMGLSPLLATSDSNVAVDNIAEGLHRAGVKVVRVGRIEKVRGHLEELTLEAMVARHRAEKKAEAEAKAAAEEEAAAAAAEEAELEDFENTFGMDDEEDVIEANDTREPPLKRPVTAEEEIRREQVQKRRQSREDYEEKLGILKNVEVICTTAISAGSEFFSRFNFHGILIDEVAQSTEASSMVPIVMRGAKQLVLVGDGCQLPPSVLSREAELRGLSLSVYNRLEGAGVEPHFLDTQYRSHPKIAEFSAKCFYNGNLRSGIPGSARPPPRGLQWPSPRVPVAFFEVGEDEVIDGESKTNPGEAKWLRELLLDILAEGEMQLSDIGVVTPYMAQVRLLRRTLREAVPGGDSRKLLEIASVDNFQGREKELIIFSAVRCNARGNVGFLADWRRLNVMLTRARRGLVVFGSAKTLRHDAHWSQWLQWCDEHGATSNAASLADTPEAVLRHTLQATKLPSPRLAQRPAVSKFAPTAKTKAMQWDSDNIATTAKTAPLGSPSSEVSTTPKSAVPSSQLGKLGLAQAVPAAVRAVPAVPSSQLGKPGLSQARTGTFPAKAKFEMAPKVGGAKPHVMPLIAPLGASSAAPSTPPWQQAHRGKPSGKPLHAPIGSGQVAPKTPPKTASRNGQEQPAVRRAPPLKAPFKAVGKATSAGNATTSTFNDIDDIHVSRNGQEQPVARKAPPLKAPFKAVGKPTSAGEVSYVAPTPKEKIIPKAKGIQPSRASGAKAAIRPSTRPSRRERFEAR